MLFCVKFLSSNIFEKNSFFQKFKFWSNWWFLKDSLADIRILELGDDLKKAQLYKSAYEQKQRAEIPDEGHKVLFFNEIIDSEADTFYYEPNGKYWEMKKDGTLKKNEHRDIFQVDTYIKEILEKEKAENIKEKSKEKEKDKRDINEVIEKTS